MTLIMMCKSGNYPFLLGDLLLSSKNKPNDPLHIPSVGDIDQEAFKEKHFFPSGIARKVCHFGNIAIAWAGNYWLASNIIKELYFDIEVNGPITKERFDDVIGKLEPDLKKALESDLVHLLVYLIDPNNRENCDFGFNFESIYSKLFDEIKIAGSGTDLFQSYFDHSSKLELDEFTIGSFETSVFNALAITGMLLQLEIGTYKNILDYFGGGYELIFVKDNQFILCDDLLFVFWTANVDENGISLSPYLKFIKQCYYNDILIFRTLKVNLPDSGDASQITSETDIQFIEPPYRNININEIKNIPIPDLKAFILCSYILVNSPKGIEVLNLFKYSKKRDLPVTFFENEKDMGFAITREYLEEIISAIENHL